MPENVELTEPATSKGSGVDGELQNIPADFAATARGYVDQGKVRLTGFIGEVEHALRDAASKLEAPGGLPVSGYVHRAADAVSDWSAAVEGKSMEELAADTKALVRAHPRVTTALALLGGFAIVRVFRST